MATRFRILILVPAVVATAMASFVVAGGARASTGTLRADTRHVSATVALPDPAVPSTLIPALAAALVLFALLALVVVARHRRSAANRAETAGSATDPNAPLPAQVAEAQVPRWRRPSVMAARFQTDSTAVVRAAMPDPIAARRAPNVFAAGNDAGGERMRLRYDGVPLLDRPDDALGRTWTDLDTGDEVLILERDEIWANVTTPAGATGWVPTMVLAASSTWVDEDPEPEIQAAPVAPRDEQPSLEVLLAAIAAERRARQELLEATPPAVASNDRGKRKSPAKARPKPSPDNRRTPRSSASPG
jgi:hypothetical protein